ncbi:MAG: protein TolR [Halofilum sp. (in: g-proteobacteria)]
MDRRSRRRPIAEINVVPYIDVMLVLLVIFMITAPLLKTGVEVTLPKADAKPMEQTQSEPLIVTVDGEGRFFINIGEDHDSPLINKKNITLATAAMRRDGDRRVLVRGDQGVNYQKVVRAMALLQRSGVPQVGLVAEAQ